VPGKPGLPQEFKVVAFWKTLIPDEPLISDGELDDTLCSNTIPPAVRSWCFVSLAANGVVVAMATPLFWNAAPLLVGIIFALFPCYMLLFWKDLASSIDDTKRKARERIPAPLQINLSPQWAVISICVAAPVMALCMNLILRFTATQ
jgi:hypothetical protein